MQLWISNIGADYTTAFRLTISLNLFSYYHADNQKEKNEIRPYSFSLE